MVCLFHTYCQYFAPKELHRDTSDVGVVVGDRRVMSLFMGGNYNDSDSDILGYPKMSGYPRISQDIQISPKIPNDTEIP